MLSSIFIGNSTFSKTLPPGTGLADVKANVLILLSSTWSMRKDMAIPVINMNGVNDSEPDSYEGNIHSVNWSGGHVTLHTYLGAAMGDYGREEGFSGQASKITRDSCNNMYGKNDGNIQKWATTPCGGSAFLWRLQPNIAMSSSDGSINCGRNDDNSDLSIYERKDELFVTDDGTQNTCVFNSDRQFLRVIDTSANRSDGGVVMPSHNQSTGMDQDLGVLYHWFNSERQLAVEFIHPELTDVNTFTPSVTLSEEYGSSVTGMDGQNYSISSSSSGRDRINDIEIDKRGDVYVWDRNATLHKFTKYNDPDGGLEYVDSLRGCQNMSSVYGFGIDLENDIAWGAAYGRSKVIGVKLDDHRDGSHDWECGMVLTDDPVSRSRMQVATDVIKRIMRDESLTGGANFGLMTWDNNPQLQIEISNTGFQEIKTFIDNQNIGTATYPLDEDDCTFRCGDPTLPDAASRNQWDAFEASADYQHEENAGAAMVDAQKYYLGTLEKPAGGTYPSPIDETASCQNSYVIIIADGSADDANAANIAAQINASNLNIITYVVGVGDEAEEAGSLTFLQGLATSGGSNTPFFAEDEAALVSSLGEAIRQVVTRPLTFSAPSIMPETTDQGEEESYIYQSVFSFKVGTEWQGSLKKYKMLDDGSIEPNATWDAGSLVPHPFLRKVWTAWPGLPNNLNNFTTGILNILFANEMYSSENQAFPSSYTIEGSDAYETVQFIRGNNSWDVDGNGNNNASRSWYLADIYHSAPALIGSPSASFDSTNEFSESYYRGQNGYESFAEAQAGRNKIVLAGSNSGLLHAFDVETGIEQWAFMPPSFIAKMLDMKPVDTASKTSIPIYGVDGSPSVKDIFYDGQWRTVVMCGLGYGGNSYFALDITDPTSPQHLFTFENDIENERVYYWDAAGVKSRYRYDANSPGTFQDPAMNDGAGGIVPPSDPLISTAPEYDFRRLGKALSKPNILRIKVDGLDKWVAVFGGGYNQLDADVASSVFVIDMELGGKILSRIDLEDVNDAGLETNLVKNSVPAQLIPITADSTSLATYYGALVYFADYEGKLWKLNLSSNGDLYEAHTLFDSGATPDNGRRNFFKIAASVDEDTGKVWLYYGTGDQRNLATANESIQNKVYGIKDADFPETDITRVSVTETDCADITGLTTCIVGSNETGWFANLDDDEKITAAPSVKSGIVYFSRYVPNVENPCTPGTAYQSRHDYQVGCAQGSVPAGQETAKIELGKGVATEAIFYKGKMYMGLSGAVEGDGTLDGLEGFSLMDNIIIGTQQAGTGSGSTSAPKINWWREIF